MSEIGIRKRILLIEEIFHVGGHAAESPVSRGAIATVLSDPVAGRRDPEIRHFMDDLRPVGLKMTQQSVEALGGAGKIEGYGKASLVGVDGEIEHGALQQAPAG